MQRITIDAQQCQGQSLLLEAAQVHYLRRVLRLGVGDRFIAQDGQGQQWLAALTDHPSSAQVVEPLRPAVRAAAPLRLIAALPKGNSFDQVVRQTTELGITHILPVLSQRSLLKPSDNKLLRWRRIAQEASEQSERITVPEIFAPMDFQQCLERLEEEVHSGLRYLCVARSAAPDALPPHLLAHLQAQLPSALGEVTLAVGPEGGWTAAEITVAIAHGYVAVSLGSVILRSVTAPITALSLVTAARELLI